MVRPSASSTEAEQEEKQHVAQQVPSAAVQEGGREPGDGADSASLARSPWPSGGWRERQAGFVLRAGCSQSACWGLLQARNRAAQPLLESRLRAPSRPAARWLPAPLQRAPGANACRPFLQPRHKTRHLNGGRGWRCRRRQRGRAFPQCAAEPQNTSMFTRISSTVIHGRLR